MLDKHLSEYADCIRQAALIEAKRGYAIYTAQDASSERAFLVAAEYRKQAIRALIDQPAPSEPHHIPDATKMVSDALPNVVQTAPAEIYLCLGDDDNVLQENFSELYEVSWSYDKATAHTIKYVRADVATVKESLTTGAGDALPGLPEPTVWDARSIALHDRPPFIIRAFTADQMHSYYRKGWADALAAVRASH